MKVVYTDEDLETFLFNEATVVSDEFPVVISKFISGAKEIEIDAVAVKGRILAQVASEHVENAGVHSGDATIVCPPFDLRPETVAKITEATRRIAGALDISGPFNIQYIAKENEIKVIECNVRASRSLPFVSKTTKVDLIDLATKAILGREADLAEIAIEQPQYYGVKVPMFSFTRLRGADPVLGNVADRQCHFTAHSLSSFFI
jgi:carbamoylphosphate synthase large subunit